MGVMTAPAQKVRLDRALQALYGVHARRLQMSIPLGAAKVATLAYIKQNVFVLTHWSKMTPGAGVTPSPRHAIELRASSDRSDRSHARAKRGLGGPQRAPKCPRTSIASV